MDQMTKILSDIVGNHRISPVSDYRHPFGSDCRIMSDFLGSDRIRRGGFALGLYFFPITRYKASNFLKKQKNMQNLCTNPIEHSQLDKK